MKELFIKIIRDIFCFKRNAIEKILNIKFKKIDQEIYDLNCFNSNDLACFIDESNEHFKGFFVKDEYNKNINLLSINSIKESKSKSSGCFFDTIYLFGKEVLIAWKSNWSFQNCINHIQQNSNNSALNLFYYKWNNRYEWQNGGGSHHFAAANFLATNNGYEYIFNCNIKSFSINKDVANRLLENYEMFVFNIEKYIINEVFETDLIDTIYVKNAHILVLLDKEKAKNKGYLNLLKLIDKKYVLYFNDYLSIRLKHL